MQVSTKGARASEQVQDSPSPLIFLYKQRDIFLEPIEFIPLAFWMRYCASIHWPGPLWPDFWCGSATILYSFFLCAQHDSLRFFSVLWFLKKQVEPALLLGWRSLFLAQLDSWLEHSHLWTYRWICNMYYVINYVMDDL